MVPLSSHRISRVRRYSGYRSSTLSFTYRTFTFFGLPSHAVQLNFVVFNAVQNPARIAPHGLASSAFARHYLRNLGWFLFLVLLRCFSSDGSPRTLIWLGMRCKGLTPCGFLHSDICGSYHACWSPQLFAAYRVLLRLLMPRHPSRALISLTYFKNYVSSLYLTLFVSVLNQQKNCFFSKLYLPKNSFNSGYLLYLRNCFPLCCFVIQFSKNSFHSLTF